MNRFQITSVDGGEANNKGAGFEKVASNGEVQLNAYNLIAPQTAGSTLSPPTANTDAVIGVNGVAANSSEPMRKFSIAQLTRFF